MLIGPTLGRYLSSRFLFMILAVFGTIFSMIYVIDLVEMLRRAGNRPGATASLIAFLSFLRAPSVSEQILPFCVLFGTMATFINLTRRLELLVARAAGISIWQLMMPPLGIALAIGIFSVTLYNPISAMMKHRADGIETELFGGIGGQETKGGLWIRQNSVDGQAIIRAETVEAGGSRLGGVTLYTYGKDGSFEARIEARHAKLVPGVWQMTEARIIVPGEEIQEAGLYLLATNLTPGEVSENIVTPESVPFWELQSFRAATELAGLDSTRYRLQFQLLLARPLFFIAMVLIAAAFSLRFFRFGGITKMVCGGAGAGFVLYIVSKFTGDLGTSGLLSAPIAAWSPAVVASMLGALALLNQEDG
ncbi:LPS export ABC transporter permease LptG [Beijerinckia indica]|uniref:Permease YjgP/YjgQ family protein n=1 Tax=Beijerinckia indica subsp. indica (strain ATCC 9039 / DSM 1715 / NCIMB 8712) TaxID=395963 RepID=B2IFU0_BEII9|nr:LPS export ABC transporter permease LptG [Beijerinckia indica]ACB94301.1 permease YjgP/YjgQ family protein [Beijerinckia indica subsp. indica ATCC 9039]